MMEVVLAVEAAVGQRVAVVLVSGGAFAAALAAAELLGCALVCGEVFHARGGALGIDDVGDAHGFVFLVLRARVTRILHGDDLVQGIAPGHDGGPSLRG